VEQGLRFGFQDQTLGAPVNQKVALPDSRLVQGQIQPRLAPGPDGEPSGAKNDAAAMAGKKLKLNHG
jgi:hypothetical protein